MKLENMQHNPFDAPIPGQSLTDTPGEAAWEQPPQYSDLQDALEHMFEQMVRPKNFKKMVALLDQGVPAEAVAQSAIFSGFSKGLWTPDMMTLMAKPAVMTVVALGERMGIDVQVAMPHQLKDNSMEDTFFQMNQQPPAPSAPTDPLAGEVPMATAPPPMEDKGGFMPKPVMNEGV